MAKAGQIFENPITGERMVFKQTAHETQGTMLDVEFFVKPSSGKGLAAHIHPFFAERIEIIAGSACYKLGATELTGEVGNEIQLPQNVSHIHPWNIGNDTLHWRKITLLNPPNASMLLASAAFFESLYALAQQGKVGPNGLPKNPLQTIVLLQALQPSAYVAGIPIWLQRPLFGVLAAIGHAVGLKSSYEATSIAVK